MMYINRTTQRTITSDHVEDDDKGLHYGVYKEEELICVASVFIDGQAARLRKFATRESCRGQGIGTALIRRILEELRDQGCQIFWCDARETACSFYERFGMAVEGGRFYKGEVPYRKMSLSLG